MTEIHRASVQISRPMGTDPGTVEAACYFIEKGNLIVLCHRDGTPIMREALRVGRRRGEAAAARMHGAAMLASPAMPGMAADEEGRDLGPRPVE